MNEFTVFDPLTLENIHGGEFMGAAESALQKLQAELLAFASTYRHEADGAKARLTMEVTLAVEEAESSAFSLKAVIKTTTPQTPAMISLAMPYSSSDGSGVAIHVKRPAARATDQARLFQHETPPGRAVAEHVDQETGEVTTAGAGG